MRQVLFAVWLALMPIAPAAADVDFIDPAPVLACAAAATDAAALRACEGAVAHPCYDAPGGETTLGMMMCLDAEGGAWEQLLNETQVRLAASEPQTETALATTHKAWLAYRESECNYRVVRWGEGSGARVALAGCFAELTAHRAQILLLQERAGN